MKANTAKLGNWIASWVSEEGAIHGFHNHYVWGDNPFRWGDYTSGHSTFSSPFLVGISIALAEKMDARGLALLEKMVRFQATSFREDGEFKHIGFQVGETAKVGLIHNMVPIVSLGLVGLHGKKYLSDEMMNLIQQAMLKGLDVGGKNYGNGRACEASCCNQDYTRLWGKMLYKVVFNDDKYDVEVKEDLDFMIKRFHVSGFPDADSCATLRALATTQDRDIVEPTEYYGLMVEPLCLAYEIFGDDRYLKEAAKIIRCVVRCSVKDENDMRRVHRLWYKNKDNEWIKLTSPMQIAGVGFTLGSILSYLKNDDCNEFAEFLNEYDETYAYYQVNRGFFLSATGWDCEVDIAPSTAWNSHDFFYMVRRYGVDENFWDTLFAPNEGISIMIGNQCVWVEDNERWAIRDFYMHNLYQQYGRKDSTVFGKDMGWTNAPGRIDSTFLWEEMPTFVKRSEGIELFRPIKAKMEIYNCSKYTYLG